MTVLVPSDPKFVCISWILMPFEKHFVVVETAPDTVICVVHAPFGAQYATRLVASARHGSAEQETASIPRPASAGTMAASFEGAPPLPPHAAKTSAARNVSANHGDPVRMVTTIFPTTFPICAP